MLYFFFNEFFFLLANPYGQCTGKVRGENWQYRVS